ncbi:MAG: arginase family protein, partial [Planctomycetota bacterium]
AFVRGVAAAVGGIPAGVYLDAHLDVRDTEGSGMPFRRLVEQCGVQRLDVVGLDPFVNSREHTQWFTEHGGRIDAIAVQDNWSDDPMFFSIDLDAIDAAHAPGVSARNPSGMSTTDAAAWASAAGRCDRVRCFDIMELCPPRDEGARTTRLAAHLFLSFLKGFAERST